MKIAKESAEIVTMTIFISIIWGFSAGCGEDENGGSKGEASLIVEPEDGYAATGPRGGPFFPIEKIYAARGGDGNVGIEVKADAEWLDVEIIEDDSEPIIQVKASINSKANDFSVGIYDAEICFEFHARGRCETMRTATLTVENKPMLVVESKDIVSIIGKKSGPFDPESAIYSLNAVFGQVEWTASSDVSWVDIAPSHGTIMSDQPSDVKAALKQEAEGLDCGGYFAKISFNNSSNRMENTTRGISLIVTPFDTSFNGKGWVTQENAAGVGSNSIGNSIAVDSMNRILVAGSISNAAGESSMALWRYNMDGSPDVAFNNSGIVVYYNIEDSEDPWARRYASGNSLAIDNEGNILVAGIHQEVLNKGVAVWKFDQDGTVDNNFGYKGRKAIYEGEEQEGTAIAIDGQGRIVVAGFVEHDDDDIDMVIYRMTRQGFEDETLGESGRVAYGGGGWQWANSLAIDDHGRLIVAGGTRDFSGNTDMLILRLEQNGELDTTFNDQGYMILKDEEPFRYSEAYSVEIDNHGRILVAGWTKNSAHYFDMIAWRFGPDGKIDSDFGKDGRITFSGEDGKLGDDKAASIKVDKNGRILIAGKSENKNGNTDAAIWRFEEDGTPDNEFNTEGVILYDGGVYDEATSIAIDDDGEILVSGMATNSDAKSEMTIWKYKTDGANDAYFNDNGYVSSSNAKGGNENDEAFSVVMDGQGRMVIAGTSQRSEGDYDMAIWRYNEDGSADIEFNSLGWVTFGEENRWWNNEIGRSTTVDEQGRIIVSGESEEDYFGADMTIWRYNEDGTPDSSFNNQGWVKHDSAAGGGGNDAGNAMAIDNSGKIVVTGYSENGVGQSAMTIWRYNQEGTLDVTFNNQGWTTHEAMIDESTIGWAIAIDREDRILVLDSDGIWRYNNDGTPDMAFNNTGWRYFENRCYGNAIAIDDRGRIVVAGVKLDENYNYHMAIWRYDPAGTIDDKFNNNGFIVFDEPEMGDAQSAANSIAIDYQGRLIVAGEISDTSGDTNMIIWRFKTDGTPDDLFGGKCWLIHDNAAGGRGDDKGNSVTIDGQGRIVVAGESLDFAGYYAMTIWRYR